MKRVIVSCSTIAIAIATVGVLAQLAPGRIDVAEFKKLHAARKVLVVDVRDAQSFATGRIAGAINIPLGDEEQAAHVKTLKAEKRPIVTYCA
jgi:rhodanese-related sulfurtransferase